MWATLLFGGTAALFLTWALSALWHLRWVRRLPVLNALLEPGRRCPAGANKCSIIIAARDEEARIERTVRHLLGQQGVEMEIIAVDDRSSDRTPEILRRLASGDARLVVKRVDVLPEGWLGKCHACHVGASAATGEWVLFTDADCWLKPDVIARALRVAELEGADHVTMAAGTVLESRAAQAWYLLFLTSLLSWFSGTNRDRPRSYVGIGAFNLVRAAAYRQCGGYQALRLTVIDDVRLGLLLRRAGKRTRSFLAGDDLMCHWGHTVGSLIKVMEKNYFAALDFRTWLAFAGVAGTVGVMGILCLGLLSGSVTGMMGGLSPFLLIVPSARLGRRLGWGWPCAVLVPFMIPVFLYSLINSTVVTLRQGGVRWRDNFYPLEMLRAGAVK